ncbi:SPOR domain-containing protein [Deinococcus roseus]|uniref:SPOR domain-containing protein n=1 Tax=Deinococcus roseus TaxID=392414 RepID=A0ABQ2CXY5_9DEIO|nr:SPOR domain-containing protein [Deinococcus roseus]GGJ30472.1 hypothetical protein GCM10008938_15680 [Deinococcus roseus]
MIWFRKHWPDLLILFFIVLILAGAVLILFGGTKKLFNLSAGQPTIQAETSTPRVEEIPLNPAPTTPETETTSQPQAESGTQSSTLSPESAGTTETTAAPETTEPASSTADPAVQETQTVPVIPSGTENTAQTSEQPVPTGNAAANAGKTAGSAGSETANTSTGSTQTESSSSASTGATQTAQPAVRVITGRSPTKQDYRISAGLYQTEAQANTIADKIKALGYPSYVFPSKDDTYVVLIGPFVNRNDADVAVGQIQAAHQNLFVYAPQNPTANAETGTTNSTSTAASSATTPSGPMYVQVGAYKRADSAVPAIDQLRSLGFAPTLRTDPNGMVRVVVGPFSGSDLQSAQAKLKEAGYADAFQIR